jgi:hypothetical protein
MKPQRNVSQEPEQPSPMLPALTGASGATTIGHDWKWPRYDARIGVAICRFCWNNEHRYCARSECACFCHVKTKRNEPKPDNESQLMLDMSNPMDITPRS